VKRVKPSAGLRIREDTSFEPGTYDLAGGEGIVIEADDVVVDGGGAVLRSVAPVPALPDDDFLYSPGDLGISREIHELLARRISLAGAGSLVFEYRFWGGRPDPAALVVSRDHELWQGRTVESGGAGAGGWTMRRCSIGSWEGDLRLKLSVPAEELTPAIPFFYDSFRLLQGGTAVWEGDARGHWGNWYNTGFTIYKRASRRFYAGTAVRAEGHSGVTVRNISAHGFLTGIDLRDCTGLTVEDNDLSDNYDDADYGWGEGMERHGAIILDRVSRSTVRRNRAQRVWNGIVLRRAEDNLLERNEISHCSNTCLKMAQSSRNTIQDNVLSWGLRIYPGEVHARDSVSLLVESGSNDNRFLRNDFTHGGDGIFIRVLDHWCSTGNLFQENDCSHANNNAVESWSPGNTYVRNRANSSSYGFWLGGSDATVLRDNEVMDNGKGPRNAPEPFGNAGVSVVHGPSTGFLLTGNRITNNAGPGISFGCKEAFPAKLWLISGNDISGNTNDPRGYPGHGILMEHAEDVVIGTNTIAGNDAREIVLGRSSRFITVDTRLARVLEGLTIQAPVPVTAGQETELSLSGPEPGRANDSPRLTWDFGDGTRQSGEGAASVRHTFARPGRTRVSVTIIRGGAAGIATRTLCVLPAGRVAAACGDGWRLTADAASSLQVEESGGPSGIPFLRAVVRGGTRSTLAWDLPAPLDISSAAGFSFFYRYSCDLSILSGRRTRTVGLRLVTPGGSRELIPDTPFTGEPSEDRYDWVYFEASVASLRSTGNPDPRDVRTLQVVFGPDAPADCIFCLDSVRAW
jgi:parallel beta-helix repeat protein